MSIKFIACDMDGTLLNNKKHLPGDFYKVFDLLSKNKILFAVASGRQYYSLKSTFETISNNMIFIAENGAYVMYQGKELYSSIIPTADIHRIIEVVSTIADSHIVLCGKKSAYINTDNPQAIDEIKNYYHRCICVDNFLDIDDEFIKVAVLNFNGTERQVFPIVSELFSATHQVVVSAEIWLDFMHKDASKGAAIKHLQNLYDVDYEQCMSFGDYFNDTEMLAETFHSYAMENAHPEIKKQARFMAPSNEQQGVTTIIKNKVLGI